MAGRRRAEQWSTAASGQHDGRRRLVGVSILLAVTALVAAIAVPAAWRTAGTDVEASGEASSLLTLVNQARASNGLAPLSYASDLSSVAADRASIIASSGSLSHTPDLGGQVCCWSWIGENVAFAGSVQSLHDVLMDSAPHRANILNADADDIGIAVVKGGGSLWAAQIFRARSDADRAGEAGSTSRDGDRSAPGGTTPGGTTWTDPGPTGSTGSTTTSTPTTAVPVLTKAEIARQQLRESLRSARAELRADRQKDGPFDPVRAAVRYSDTLDAVTG